MKILFITSKVPFPPDDGGKIVTFETIRELAIRGNEITLVCFNSDQNKGLYEICRYCRLQLVKANIHNSYPKAFMNLFSSIPYTISKYQSDSFKDKLKHLISKNRYDVAVVDHLHMAAYGLFIKEQFKIPVILREHNLETVIWQRLYLETKNLLLKVYAWLQYKRFFKYESTIAARFDKCMMISSTDKLKIESMNPSIKACVIPAGVDTSYFFPLAINEEQNSIISVGSLDWYPNVEGILWFLSDIWPLIKTEIPVAKFYIVGKNPPYKLIKLLSDDVVVTGYVKDVREYIAKSPVFVVPIKTGSGVRIKILNAMAMGKAIVSTAVGCEGLDIESEKNIYIAQTGQQFAEYVIKLLKNKDERVRLGNEAQKLIKQQYSWDLIGEMIENELKLTIGCKASVSK